MSTEDQIVEEVVGTHTFRFEPPDVIVARFIGDVAEEQIRALALMFKRAPERIYGIMITDQLKAISSAAKKAIKDMPVADGVAIVGASRQMQFVISLLNKVLVIAHLGKNAPITFVQTEDEARRWVEHLRGGPEVK